MKTLKCILFLSFISAGVGLKCFAQDTIPPANRPVVSKTFEKLGGEWKITSIYKAGKDITNKSSAEAVSESLIFKTDGKYVRKKGEQLTDEGSYRVNEDHSILFLETGKQQVPIEWNVSFNDGNLVLGGRGSGHAENYRFVYSKIK